MSNLAHGEHEVPPFTLVSVESHQEKVVVGETRVQNRLGESGLVVWMGEMDHGKWGNGLFCGVHMDNPNSCNEKRTDGTYNGTRHCTTPAHSCDFRPVRHLFFDVNPLVIKHLGGKFGEQIAHMHDFELVKVAIARGFDAKQMDEAVAKTIEWHKANSPDPARVVPPKGDHLPSASLSYRCS